MGTVSVIKSKGGLTYVLLHPCKTKNVVSRFSLMHNTLLHKRAREREERRTHTSAHIIHRYKQSTYKVMNITSPFFQLIFCFQYLKNENGTQKVRRQIS